MPYVHLCVHTCKSACMFPTDTNGDMLNIYQLVYCYGVNFPQKFKTKFHCVFAVCVLQSFFYNQILLCNSGWHSKYSVVQNELTIIADLLPQPPSWWDYSHVPPLPNISCNLLLECRGLVTLIFTCLACVTYSLLLIVTAF